MRRLALDTAANRLSSSQNLLDSSRELLSKRLGSHLSGNVVDLIKRNVSVVLDVLLLLTVTRRLLKSSDDQRRCRRNHRHLGLTVLNGELDGHTDTLEVLGGLSNVFTDLLGRQTKRTNLGGQGRRGTNLSSGGSQVDDLNFVGVDLMVRTGSPQSHQRRCFASLQMYLP